MVALLTLAPLLVSLLYHEYDASARYLTLILPLATLGFLAARLPTPHRLQANEAFVIIALAFLLTPLLMAYPMAGVGLGTGDALFEAISAITTTGLSTLPSVEDKPRHFLFLRAWMQWYGGLGILVFSIALLLRNHVASRCLIEASGEEGLITTTRVHARRMLRVYLGLTLIGLLAVWIACGDFFDALIHTLAAVSTGGFSSHDTSLAGLGTPWAATAVTLVAFGGAVSLPLYYFAARQGWRRLLADMEFRALWLLALTLSLGLWMLLRRTMDEGTAISHALFLGFSAQSTTGFTAMPLNGADPGIKLLLIFAMASGGSLGSTAGGIKLFRLLVLWRLAILLIRRTGTPAHAVVRPRFGDRHLESDELANLLLVILLFLATIVLSWLPFVLQGQDPLDSLFEVVSATGTVGLSSGISNLQLAGPLKAILCLDMLLGRLEILALLVTFYPGTWLGKRTAVL
ncbi:MAG: TrkH family potassium uptake protein [Gammaproteobacteria bacterium]|nr:TrkH family potassium uptake protein [Gammaproteobacteria bacterium]MBU1656077.1 TrkH family potassium uptake protein [Gammaproteobacteria bacterium]MBU1960346.1 TrkH family potassium uptake protein [Gammaproteobacteria bacterium]